MWVIFEDKVEKIVFWTRLLPDQIQNNDQNIDGANRFHQHPQSMQSLNYFLYLKNIRQFCFLCRLIIKFFTYASAYICNHLFLFLHVLIQRFNALSENV